jgi:hypothetical protein
MCEKTCSSDPVSVFSINFTGFLLPETGAVVLGGGGEAKNLASNEAEASDSTRDSSAEESDSKVGNSNKPARSPM